RVHFRSPGDARRLGLDTVYQDVAVAASLDVAANILLGREVRRGGAIDFLTRVLDTRGVRREPVRDVAALHVGVPWHPPPVGTRHTHTVPEAVPAMPRAPLAELERLPDPHADDEPTPRSEP